MSLAPLLDASPVIQIHALCATLALILGAVQLFRRKGDPAHRANGYIWVSLMAVVAVSSFFIWTIRTFWLFSPIHLISVFVLVMLWLGVRRARRGDIDRHRKTMKVTYLLGLIVTGLLTLVPGRIMYRAAFGPDGATTSGLLAFAAVAAVIALAVWGIVRWRTTPQGAAFVESH